MDIAKTKELFDLSHTAAREYLSAYEYPWEALDGIGEMITALGKTLDPLEYEEWETDVWVSRSAHVASTAKLSAPCIVGHGSEIRHCAFIRGNALIGADCVVGNSTELKNCILLDGAQVPHYNYVGDSVLGYRAHMGAGSVTANLKTDGSHVTVRFGSGECVTTGRRKVGAMLGDYAEIGCGSVLNPGTVVGRGASVYPLSSVRGVIPPNTIFKSDGTVVKRER